MTVLVVTAGHFTRELAQVDLLPLEMEPAGRDAGDIEQLIDEARKLLRLAYGGIRGFEHAVGSAVGSAAERACEELDLQRQRRERRPQLMRRDRQEVLTSLDRAIALRDECPENESGGGENARSHILCDLGNQPTPPTLITDTYQLAAAYATASGIFGIDTQGGSLLLAPHTLLVAKA